MITTFWVYAPSFEDEHGSSGAFAGFCGNKNVHGICACHHDCVAIDVVEMKTWNEARRHANYLANFRPDDGITDPDDLLEQPTIAEAEKALEQQGAQTTAGSGVAPATAATAGTGSAQ